MDNNSRVRAILYEEELQRQKKFLVNGSYAVGGGSGDFPVLRKTSKGLAGPLFGSHAHGKPEENVRRHVANAAETWRQQQADEKVQEKPDTVQVREFIEKLVETLIEGPLDGTTVGQLSTHPAYSNELSFSDSTQTNLKRLIKQIISEAMALPNIKGILCRPKSAKEAIDDDLQNKSYEDILATAILNKVVEHFQENGNIRKNKKNETPDGHLRRRAAGKKIRRKVNDDELKPNSDWSDASRSDQLSLTIEEYIEEVTTALEVSEDEKCEFSDDETSNRRIPFPESGRTVIDGSDEENSELDEQSSVTELIASTNSWEENWLFQKKRLRSTPNAHHPVPVPMLVPNPSEDFRALVGGVDADDLSDMSDCSDSALEELIAIDEEPALSPSKAELKPHGREVDESEGESDSEKDGEAESDPGSGYEKKRERNSNNENDERKDVEVAPADVAEVENERALEEICDEVKTDVFAPTSPAVQKDREFSIEDFDLSHRCESTHHGILSGGTSETATVCGSDRANTLRWPIAEREKEKWNNAILLPDNPYSPENIAKREQRHKIRYFRLGAYSEDLVDEFASRSENSRIARDYYVNCSRFPSGMSSSSSSNRLSETHDQVLKVKETHKAAQEITNCEMEPNAVQPRARVIDRSQFCLPNVKELAKQFTTDTRNPSSKAEIATELESKEKVQVSKTGDFEENKHEIDYSTTPVTEIIRNLQQESDPLVQGANNQLAFTEAQTTTIMHTYRKHKGNHSTETRTEKCVRNAGEMQELRYNGKQVHSLTARSISKEFREGLKNNNYCQKVPVKINRGSSGVENDEAELIGKNGKTSPTPLIDLKNMKKFWEEIITANSNTTKDK